MSSNGNEKSSAARVLNAHAAVSIVLIVVAAVLYGLHALDLSTTLGMIGIAITLVGGNAGAMIAAGKYQERRTPSGSRVVGESSAAESAPAGHSVTVENRTTIAPEGAGDPEKEGRPEPPAPGAPNAS